MSTSALPRETPRTSPTASRWTPSPPECPSASRTTTMARYDFSYRRSHSHLDIASPAHRTCRNSRPDRTHLNDPTESESR
jgi:hypothetical protein